MTWGKIKVEEQRHLFIKAYLEKRFNISSLCRQFDISRPTGYKWIERYNNQGWEGLQELSREPLISPNKTPPAVVDEILKLKYQWPEWGPKKILGDLNNRRSDIKWPSVTTIENILNEYGLVVKRKLRKRFAQTIDPLGECNSSNDIWCMDFKGWSLTKDQQRIDPFTITDAFSRYLLCCQKLIVNDTTYVWAVFERLFKEYGLPLRVRSDNGPPFATLGAGRLSKLSIRLIKAGVIPEWIDPGEPQQNGRHERMHLTLKKEGIDSRIDLKTQINKLEAFTNYYNFIRPHEALGQKQPASIYKPSLRSWNGRLRSPEYSGEYKVNTVGSCGKMPWRGGVVYIGRAFENEPIGIKVEGDNLHAYYGPVFLGAVNGNTLDIKRRPGRNRY